MDFEMKMLAYCGLYCEQCSARIAALEKDWRYLEGIPSIFKKGRTELNEFACEGCKGKNSCRTCGIKECVVAKGINSCAECGDFPCTMIDAFENDGFPHHKQGIENLRRIRKDGIEAWFADLEPSLRCHCGTRQCWYHPCPVHGG